MRAAGLVLAAFVSGCSFGLEESFIALPERATAKSYILAIENDGPELLIAAEVDDPLEIAAGDSPRRMHLLFFDATLQTLGLEKGPIPEEKLATRATDCRLGRPDEVLVSSIIAGRPQPWAAAPAPEPIMRRLAPHVRCVRCATLREHRVPSPPSSTESAAFLTSGAAFIALRNGQQARLTLDEFQPLSGCDGAVYYSALNIGPNQFWLGTDGAAVRVTIDESAKTCTVEERRELTRENAGENVFHLAFDRDLFALTSSGALMRWRDDRWNLLAQLPLFENDRDEGSTRGGLGAVDGVLYATAGAPQIDVFTATGRRTERLEDGPLGISQRIESLAAVEGIGVFAGDDVGRIFQRQESGLWAARTQGPIFEIVGAIAGFRDGVIAMVRSSLIEFPPQGSRCEDRAFGGDTERRMIASLDRILLPQTLVDSDLPEDRFLWLVIEP